MSTFLPRSSLAVVLGLVVALGGIAAGPALGTSTVRPYPGMVITHDVTFTPGQYAFPEGNGIRIARDGVAVDGNGAVLTGPGVTGDPDSYAGTGVNAAGVSDVSLSGLSVKGFNVGLHVSNGSGWDIRSNDFSGNYDDPAVAWTDGPDYGAMLLEDVNGSTVADNTARRNWNGLYLRGSEDNDVRDNDISHCSNVCLKMWRASRNRIADNDFSYGIRQVDEACQTHACDSTSALLETGSNNNRITGNDFTHGGDGVFLRPLNGVVSTGNVFEGNDASYANNNAWESWSPGNTFIDNKGNHSSYGFWLGGSDRSVLIGNEAAYNGVEKHNAPEKRFGNAGIAIVKGSASHILLAENNIHDNNGAGLALGYKADYPVYHWVVRSNRIVDNSSHGVYAYNADWIDIVGNQIARNGGDAVHEADGVHDLTVRQAPLDAPAPHAEARLSAQQVTVDEPITLTAAGSTAPDDRDLTYRWELGDGTTATTQSVTHRFTKPGFYRVGVTVDDGRLEDLAGLDVYVVDDSPEMGTDAHPDAWGVATPPRPFDWTVDSSPPEAPSGPAYYSGSGPNFDRGILHPATVSTDDPTLTFDNRYSIESGWDYGYVVVSTDSGRTLHAIANEHTVPADHGPGLTGDSDGWRQETFDLSDYAGQDVLVGFRYVTDGGVDEPGWWVDNVHVSGTLLGGGSSLDGWQPWPAPEKTFVEVTNTRDHVAGVRALRIRTNARSGRFWFPRARNADWDTTSDHSLVLWIGAEHDGMAGFTGPHPVVRLQSSNGAVEYQPDRNLLQPWSLPYSEARNGWQRIEIPLDGSDSWTKTTTGQFDPKHVQSVELRTSSTRGPYTVRFDGITFLG